MADETKVEAQAVAEAPAEAPAKVAEVVADVVETVAKTEAPASRPARSAKPRRVKRETVIEKTAIKAASRRTARKTHTAAPRTRAAKERTQTVTKTNYFNADAIPAFAPLQSIFTEANERGQELVKRSQKVAEELADLARANVEAVVEAGRVAAEGARTIGQDAVSSSREGFEQAADAIRSFAEAKSPTEYLQLQSDFARASFDRAVAESSKLTESLVKLAGEAFQPISSRASANAERFNTLVA
ncbi:MAG TPA: phasin family protein [Sphingomicrobium sp.]|nr:phasin family protein [Sphingomicrobium sp.]